MFRQFTIPKLVNALTIVAVFTMAVRVPTSPDMWWHLACGRTQWQMRTILREDIFSHTALGTPWVNQSWLVQLSMYGLYTRGGFPALSLAVASLVTVAFVFCLGSMQGKGRYGHFGKALIVLWAAISTGRVWAARPHLITFVLTAAWLYTLDRRRRTKQGGAKALAWLPPLMLLWANTHGGYIVGFVLLAAEIGGMSIDELARRRFNRLWPAIRPIAITTLLCVLAALANPQGVRLLLFPFQTLSSGAQQNMIAEWASPDFHATDMLPFLGLLLATWSLTALGSAETDGVDWLRLLGFTFMAMRSGRYIGLCALVAAPMLFRGGRATLARLLLNWGRRISSAPPSRGIPALNWILLAALLLAATAKLIPPLQTRTIETVHSQIYPIAATAYAQRHGIVPNLFNEYAWGGYLIWSLYPQTLVFIDGRADPYGDDLIAAYHATITARPGWQQILEKYDVRTALIPSNSALAAALGASPAWQQAYQDEQATLYQRP
jgi:hypothetical protein